MNQALDPGLLRTMIDNAQDILGVLDEAGCFIFSNAELQRVLGHDPEALVGDNAFAMVHPDDLPAVQAAVDKARSSGQAQQVSYRFIHQDGTYRNLHGRARLTEGPQGTPCLVFATRDVTETLQIDAARRESENRFRGLVEAAPDAVVVFQDDHIVLANSAAGRMLGDHGADALTGMHIDALLHPEDRAITHQRIQQAAAGEALQPLERRMRRPDGTDVWTEALGSMTTWMGRPAVLAVVRDTTERRAAADALAQANTDLRAANFELSQFAEIATHDLQEPLRTINSFLQLLERRAGSALDDESRDCIQQALGGVHRLQDLLDDLRDFNQVGAKSMADGPVSVARALAAAQQALHASIAASQAQISTDTLPTVLGDDQLITQVFEQLLANAIKYAQDGLPPTVHVSAEWRFSRWCIAVRDNGIGIAKEHQSKVFEIFRRLHTQDQRPGTGIGLATARRILERHGGRIWVESTPGDGSTFYFTLPPGGPGK